METVILDPENQDPASPGNVEKAFTPSALEYDPTIPARYMVRKIDSRSVISVDHSFIGWNRRGQNYLLF